MNNKQIGFDIGGTGVQYNNGDELKSFSTEGLNKEQVLDKMAEVIKATGAKEIGIASPGAVNQKTGYVSGITGIKDWGYFNLYEELKQRVEIEKVQATNDANCALLGEMESKSGVENAVMITIGTGIGGAVVINGKPMNGKNGFGGEFGYSLQIGTNREQVSTLIAAKSLIERVNKLSDEFNFVDAKGILESDNKEAWGEINNWFSDVARFVISKWYDFDPEVIYIAGGVTKYPKFEEILNKNIKNWCEKWNYTYIPVVEVTKESNPGVIGAKVLLK